MTKEKCATSTFSTMIGYLLLATVLTACGSRFNASDFYPPKLVKSQDSLNQAQIDYIRQAIDGEMPRLLAPSRELQAALEYGSLATPHFAAALAEPNDEDMRRRAAFGLAFVGDSESREILRSNYERNKTAWGHGLLCTSLAIVATEKEIQFLIDSLDHEYPGLQIDALDNAYDEHERRSIRETAAIALGALRAEQGIDILTKCTESDKYSDLENECALALRWIREEYFEVPKPSFSGEDEQVILTVLKHGNPSPDLFESGRGNRSQVFFEKAAGRLWTTQGYSWKSEIIESRDRRKYRHTPKLDFDVWLSSDGLRATVIMEMYWAPLYASGWEFVLRKDDGIWRVIAVSMAWIS